MTINRDKPHLWKSDVLTSVRQYNDWYLDAAPEAYRETRQNVVNDVENLFAATNNMRDVNPQIILNDPAILATLRMSTAPPIARDRLAGLAYAPRLLVKVLEDGIIPPRISRSDLLSHVGRMCDVIEHLLDRTLFDWLGGPAAPSDYQRELAAVVVSDRRCGAVSDPIVRNAQETRQLQVIGDWLDSHGYRHGAHPVNVPLTRWAPGTYSFRRNVPVQNDAGKTINMPVDAVIQPLTPRPSGMPILVEAKSAGDFTNTNKRRKEEATKARQLRATYGDDVELLLFLCGYFDAGYLGYEAAEGIDWIWEHRPDDFALAGL